MFSGPEKTCLGIEAGGTRTVALLSNQKLEVLGREEFGPANVRLLTDQALVQRFREIAASFPRPAAICAGVAGAREEKDRAHACSTGFPSPPGACRRFQRRLLAALPRQSLLQSARQSAGFRVGDFDCLVTSLY